MGVDVSIINTRHLPEGAVENVVEYESEEAAETAFQTFQPMLEEGKDMKRIGKMIIIYEKYAIRTYRITDPRGIFGSGGGT